MITVVRTEFDNGSMSSSRKVKSRCATRFEKCKESPLELSLSIFGTYMKLRPSFASSFCLPVVLLPASFNATFFLQEQSREMSCTSGQLFDVVGVDLCEKKAFRAFQQWNLS